MKHVNAIGLILLTAAGAAPLARQTEVGRPPATAKATGLRFEVSVAPGLINAPRSGRLLVVLSREARPEPRFSISRTGLKTPPYLGTDLDGLQNGVVGVLGEKSAIFPIPSLADLPAGEYSLQAVFHDNRDLNLPNAPGNLYSDVYKVTLVPAAGGTVKVELNRQIPLDEMPKDTENLKFLKLRSKLLSDFFGRPMYLRAGVLLPRDFQKEPDRRYPLRVHIGGYGTRFTAVRGFQGRWMADGTPSMILLHLDGAGPFGDPYQVNSDNQGPLGDAITQELIPYVEKTFRGIGEPFARFTDGGSTGGWVSLALQVFYPDFFNGCWSSCPDPVDFRAYELINIYEDDNAYVNRFGFERPAMRQTTGETVYTVRHECQLEVVLGRGNRWELSGKDWCAWNATFGPRGPDGLPIPLWDGKTGKINRSVVEHWKKYDLRRVLENNWPALAPKLHGKIHIWVGDADDYFLNNAVHLLDAFLNKANPPYGGRIEYGPGRGHTTGWTDRQIMDEMIAAMERGRNAARK
jgi:hypothetical protein